MQRVLVVQHEAETGPGWWGDWLDGAGVALDTHHAYAQEDRPALTEYDGLLVLGGAMGPVEDEAHPWLLSVRDLLAEAVRIELPTMGICLGAEMLAVACGGSVRRGLAGPEIGVMDIEMSAEAADDRVLGSLPRRPRVLQWHWEEMDRLPPRSVLLGSSPAYPHQAFRIGAAAWGIQGHPEVTPGIARQWAREDSSLLREAGRRPDDLVAEIEMATDELVGTWKPVAEAFAGVVRADASRVAQGT